MSRAASKGESTPGGRRIKGTLHWVSAAHAVEAEARLYDRLFLSEQPANVEDMEKDLNPESLVVLRAKLEPSLAQAKPGEPGRPRRPNACSSTSR